MSKNLVELMAKAYWHNDEIETAKRILSVVKEHLGEVAKLCDCVYESYCDTVSPDKHCEKCHGTGVIARTEGDVCLKK